MIVFIIHYGNLIQQQTVIWSISVLQTKTSRSVWDQKLLVWNRKFWCISSVEWSDVLTFWLRLSVLNTGWEVWIINCMCSLHEKLSWPLVQSDYWLTKHTSLKLSLLVQSCDWQHTLVHTNMFTCQAQGWFHLSEKNSKYLLVRSD